MKGLNKKQNPIIDAITELREAVYYEHLEHLGHHLTEGEEEDCSVCSRLDRCLEAIEEMQIKDVRPGRETQPEPPQESETIKRIELFHATLEGMRRICDRSGKDSEGSRAIAAATDFFEVTFKEELK